MAIIWKFGQLKIWKKKFGNNLEIWETFGMLDKFQKFGKFWNLEIKFENLEKKLKFGKNVEIWDTIWKFGGNFENNWQFGKNRKLKKELEI